MKWSLLHTLLLLAFVIAGKADDIELPDDFSVEEGDEDILRHIEEERLAKDLARENELAGKIANEILTGQNDINSPVAEIDPCSKIHCGAGRICLAEGHEPKCVCIPYCPDETDPRRRVCTNHNETWKSDCEVYRHRCLCDKKSDECKGEDYKHVHIDYYGECKLLPKCSEEEMEDFPRRMRDWLFNVMSDLAEREELSEHFLKMQTEAETNLTRRWTNAAIWKWCDLDGDTDRSVSRHELFPIRAPLVSLEHCIAPFLESCDEDDNHRITLKEWGHCLKLEEDELEEKCENVRKQQ